MPRKKGVATAQLRRLGTRLWGTLHKHTLAREILTAKSGTNDAINLFDSFTIRAYLSS